MSDPIKAIEATAAPSGVGHFGVWDARSDASAPSGSGSDDAGGVDPESLREAIGSLRDRLGERGVDLTYRVDPDLKRVIVEIVDRTDGTVLRQIPGEEVLRLARQMQDGHGGLLQVKA